ncbi:hypothetical protein F2Q69_00019192 [Brassica cretica]|uniref:Serine-threonine/tyrosine-protein kinase catalytic domain-containing protein n=1 Tax=Brassica cretica TaxID=69181 RepID=A0A8S9Q6X5_BRACR|nr:hypothetical protein F2Q69_00019192 [Brassica cretica]
MLNEEAESLGEIHHPNLVKLLDKPVQINLLDIHGFMFLSTEEEALPWETRVKIAIGVAEAIAFLHSIKKIPIHQELHMHNIMLDENDTQPLFQSTSALYRFSKYFKGLKPHIRSLSKNKLGSLTKRVKEAFSDLCVKQEQMMRMPTPENVRAEQEASARWQRVSDIEEKINLLDIHGFMFLSTEEEALPWETRVKIAIGVAEAIAFLHSIKKIPIHQELHMHNIMLDENDTQPLFQSTSALYRFSKYLKGLKPHIRSLSKNKLGSLTKRVKEAFSDLCVKQEQMMRMPTPETVRAEQEASARWQRVSDIEEKV